MQLMVRLRKTRRITWMLLTIMAAPYISVGAMAATPETIRQSVVLFPLDAQDQLADKLIASDLNEMLGDGLSAYQPFRVVNYNERMPAVQRAVSMYPERRTATTGPFYADERSVGNAVAFAKAMSADLLVVGSIKEYRFNAEEGAAEVQVSVEVFDGKTGRSVQKANAVGQGAKSPAIESVVEANIRHEAVKDAAGKIIKELTGMEYKAETTARQPVMQVKKSKDTSWIPMLLLSLGVGLLLGSSSSNGGNGDAPPTTGGDDPLPPPPPPF